MSELNHKFLNKNEKHRQLEADISMLVQGRNRKINGLKIQLQVSKANLSDAVNASLGQSLMQIISEKFNGELRIKQSWSYQSKQINTYNCIKDTIEDSDEALNKGNADLIVSNIAKATNELNPRSKLHSHQRPLNNDIMMLLLV